MLDKIKRTVKHTAVYALGTTVSKLVGFILLPIYTREITVSDYGALGLFEVFETLGVSVLSIGLPTALLRWTNLAQNEDKRKGYVFTIFTCLVVISLMSFATILPFRAFLSTWLFGDTQYSSLFIYVALSIAFRVLNSVSLNLLRSEERSLLYSISIIVQLMISLFLNIYLVAVLKWGIKGIIVAQTASSGFFFVVLLPYMVRRMMPPLDLAELRRMVQFGFPLIFSAVASIILTIGDRYLLSKLSTLSEVGLYTLGYRFGNVLRLFLVEAFFTSFVVIAWKVVQSNENPKRFFSKTLTYLVYVLLWAGLFISAYAQGIIHQFATSQTYWEAYRVIPFLVLGVVLIGIQRVFAFGLQVAEKTKYLPIVIGAAAAINIALNLALIPEFGMMGAAYATVLSYLFAALFNYFIVQRFYAIQYEVRRIAVLFLVAMGLYLLTIPLSDLSLLQRIVYKCFIILSYPFVLYVIRFYEAVELERIIGSIRKWIRKIRKVLLV